MKNKDQKLIWEAYVAESMVLLTFLERVEREFRDLQREMGLGFEMSTPREKIASLIAQRPAFDNAKLNSLPVEEWITKWLDDRNIGR